MKGDDYGDVSGAALRYQFRSEVQQVLYVYHIGPPPMEKRPDDEPGIRIVETVEESANASEAAVPTGGRQTLDDDGSVIFPLNVCSYILPIGGT